MVQIHVPPPFFFIADLAQPAEHIHGKDGVFGSNPKIGSTNENNSFGEIKIFGAFLMHVIIPESDIISLNLKIHMKIYR